MSLAFTLLATDGAARAGRLQTAHGPIDTPVFMPVGTAGTVKAMTADAVRATARVVVLGNTYHLMLRPGAERVAELGGLHRFMDWPGPILTDSGGFQVMSLASLRSWTHDGVTFRSHLDGSAHRLTPARSIEIQHLLDATITMAFDECTPFPATRATAGASLDLTQRWAARSKEAFVPRAGYGLFGIVQGSTFPDLRAAGAAALRAIGFDGYALGGLAVGEGQAAMFGALEAPCRTCRGQAALPHGRRHAGRSARRRGTRGRHVRLRDPDARWPHRAGLHVLGCGQPAQCPLRGRRHPLDPLCRCPACTRHGRAYLHHLFRAGEMLGPMLLTWHNLQYFQELMRGMRAAIAEGRLRAHMDAVRAGWGAPRTRHDGDQPPDPARPHGRAADASRRGAARARAEPRKGRHYVVRFTPRVHLALPDHRPAGFRAHRARLHPA